MKVLENIIGSEKMERGKIINYNLKGWEYLPEKRNERIKKRLPRRLKQFQRNQKEAA